MSTVGSTTTSKRGDVSVRVVPFAGKPGEWKDWKDKFAVKAAINGYDRVLSGEDKVPPLYDDKGNKLTLSEEEKKISDANTTGFGELMLSINTEEPEGKVAFAMIKAAKTKIYPHGNLLTAFKRMQAKYEPNNTPQLVQLTKEFHSKTLKPGQDPDHFITYMEALRVRLDEMDYPITEKALIIHILNSLTPEYVIEIKMLEHRMQQLKDVNKELTIEDVRLELNLRYARMKLNSTMPKESKVVEYANYMGSRFRGKCHWCGKIGHKSVECRLRISGKPKMSNDGKSEQSTKSSNSENQSTLSSDITNRKNKFCTFCKNKGHTVQECRKKKAQMTNLSNVKEIACMALETSSDDEETPRFGRCEYCLRWGPAFQYCTQCGEDSGRIYYPVSSQDAPYEEQFEEEHDTYTEAYTGTETYEDVLNDPDGNAERDENGRVVIKVTTLEFAITTPHPPVAGYNNDPFRALSIVQLFSQIWHNTRMRDYLVFRHEDDYAHERTEMVDKFGYKTIPMVIQNTHNINFNVRLYNEYKTGPDSYKMVPLFPEELDAIRIYGVKMLQQYVVQWSPGHELHNLPIHHRGMSTELIYPTSIPDANVPAVSDNSAMVPIKTDDTVTTTEEPPTKTEDMEDVFPVPPKRRFKTEAPTETINAMTDGKWNIPRKTSKPSTPLRTEPGLDKIMMMCDDNKYLWMGDSGSSCHFTNDDSGLFNWKPIKEGISLGDGRKVYATKIGTLRLEVHQKNGSKSIVYLPECKYIKNIPTNLFSITRALAHGWNLRNNGVQLVLTNQGQKIVFDLVESTRTGFVMKVKMVPMPPQNRSSELMCSMTTRGTSATSPPIPGNEILQEMAKEVKAQRAFSNGNKTPTDCFYYNHVCHKDPDMNANREKELKQLRAFLQKPLTDLEAEEDALMEKLGDVKEIHGDDQINLISDSAMNKFIADVQEIKQQTSSPKQRKKRKQRKHWSKRKHICHTNPDVPCAHVSHQKHTCHKNPDVPCHHITHKLDKPILPEDHPTEWQLVVNDKKIKASQPTITDGIDINTYHDICGHVNGDILRMTAKYYNIGLSGTLKTCLPCTLAKIPRSPISRERNERSTIPGERIFVDISYFSKPSIAGNQYWLLIVDDATDMAWSVFLKHKSDLCERLVNFIYNMKSRGTPIKYIRLDNSGENVAFQKQCDRLFLNIKFEFTSPDTPQQNGRVERKFAILYTYMRSLLNAANLTRDLKNLLWAEAAMHSTDIINGLCTSVNSKPPYTQFYGSDPAYFPYLRPFGELTVIARVSKIKSKMGDRGFLGLYLGRVPDHTLDTYRFLNLTTNKVLLSRNVKFLNMKYGDHMPPVNIANRFNVLYMDDDDDDDVSPAPTHGDFISPLFTDVNTAIHHPSPSTTSVDLPSDDDDDGMPDLEPASPPTSLPVIDENPFESMDESHDPPFFPSPQPKPNRTSTRLSRELKKLDGHLDFFKHTPPWQTTNATTINTALDPVVPVDTNISVAGGDTTTIHLTDPPINHHIDDPPPNPPDTTDYALQPDDPPPDPSNNPPTEIAMLMKEPPSEVNPYGVTMNGAGLDGARLYI